jgi:hypothetical protein
MTIVISYTCTKMCCSLNLCLIVNYTLKSDATDDPRGIIYDCKMFIVQATAYIVDDGIDISFRTS